MTYGLREKRLSRLGNSFALILDRPMLHSLGIGPSSKLRVHSDGQRIIIEAARSKHDPAFASSAAFAIRRDALIQSARFLEACVGPEAMEALGAGRVHFGRFVSRIRYQTRSSTTDDLVMDRLEHVRFVYESSATATIEDAVAAALKALPGD
jgi:antitoxin component of MazEF toxin-antitoxin module